MITLSRVESRGSHTTAILTGWLAEYGAQRTEEKSLKKSTFNVER